jgi:WhiB family redox-sensing transcriptional regulator
MTGSRGVRPERVRAVVASLGFTAPIERDWRERAACSGTDPEVFYPVGTGSRIYAEVAAAKRVCAACLVREMCLAEAMASEDPAMRWGVVGGLSAAERSELFENRRAHQIGEVA